MDTLGWTPSYVTTSYGQGALLGNSVRHHIGTVLARTNLPEIYALSKDRIYVHKWEFTGPRSIKSASAR